ncbi:MAG: histidine kinase dimerization/phospho-acceptor domain-containing protein [Actinomycetes bacterium]
MSSEPAGGRQSIVTRTVLMTSAIAALAIVIAGLISYPLVRSTALTQAHNSLARLADLTVSALERDSFVGGRNEPLPGPLADTLRAEDVTGYIVMMGGVDVPGLTSKQLQRVLGGAPVTTEGRTKDGDVLVEARPFGMGMAVVLEQPVSVVGVTAIDVIRRVVIALILGLLIAIPIGYVAARRLTRPLRAARDAANQMAQGSRDVRLEPEGPQEIADIAVSLNRLSTALSLSEGRQRDFLLSVSHELRTPLTAVKGYAEAMADGVVPADEVERTAQTVVSEAERLDRLVTDLLDLARLGAVDFRVNPAETDLDELVADAALVWADRAARHDVELRVERPGSPLLITTDPMRARQILDNLAENALRVSPAGSVIVLAVRAAESGAILEVRDSGPGLTDDDVSVAFEPGVLHERYRGVRPVGTGLGLALVGKLAGGLGGSAEAGTAAEGGARFTVHLPAAT